ncbi:hypothetical protein GmHk_16G045711 [Glycine max]|nr:hypothetical protein GmHk_16G045711 [Glycine max]
MVSMSAESRHVCFTLRRRCYPSATTMAPTSFHLLPHSLPPTSLDFLWFCAENECAYEFVSAVKGKPWGSGRVLMRREK